jgi:hypothetical protein
MPAQACAIHNAEEVFTMQKTSLPNTHGQARNRIKMNSVESIRSREEET